MKTNLRKLAYFALDSLKKGGVKEGIEALERSENDAHFYNTYKTKSIDNFLKSLKEVPFYKDVNPAKDFTQFPVLQKPYIQEHIDLFLSKAYRKDVLVEVSTSGSYGLPATFYLTKNKKALQLAEVVHYGRKAGYDIGTKHMYIRSVVHKSKFKQFVQNEYYLGCKNLDAEFLDKARKLLKSKRIEVIIGFPTAIQMIAEHCKRQGDLPSEFSIKGVITSSENLSAQQRSIMKDAWGEIDICSRYSTEEFGVLACQYKEEGKFYVNSLNYHIELLKIDSDEPCAPGEVGRIIVTDLNSYANPLVRYDTGDLALCDGSEKDKFGSIVSFQSLVGRGIQVITTPTGELKYPLFFECIMEAFSEHISQYQIIQESNVLYRVLMVSKSALDQSIKEAVKSAVLDWLGDEAQIVMEEVENIEALPSGKRPYVINKTLG